MRKTIIAAILLTLALSLNWYKPRIMKDCYEQEDMYGIFPWSENPQVSSSHPLWLLFHVLTSIFLLLIGFLLIAIFDNVIEVDECSLKILVNTHDILYDVFFITILLNIHHFGEFDTHMAVLLNGIPLFASLLTFIFSKKLLDAHFRQYVLITIPVIFEAIMMILIN